MFPNISPFIILFIVLLTIIIGLTVIITGFFSKTGNFAYMFVKLYSRLILSVSRIKVTVIGIKNIEKDVSYIVMSNHVSNYDPVIAAASLPMQLRYVFKKELKNIPIFGWALFSLKMVMVDRKNKELAIKQLNDSIKILDGVRNIIMFAEGTRSLDGKLQPFKKGGFHLAYDNKFPILPVTIAGSYDILPKGKLKVMPGNVTLVIDKPLNPSDDSYKNVESLIEKVRTIMERNLKNYGRI